jgi:CO/xanthine dehydrogenase FAD-binding subunit
MAAAKNQIYFPAGFQELFSIWERLNDTPLYAGGTGHMRYGDSYELPRNIISLDKLEELKKISRTERYIEIGAMVTLNEIIRMGKIVPEVLIQCLENIEGPQLRKLATIGGNICNRCGMMDAIGPMIALDAQFELRTTLSSRWITASRFLSPAGLPILEPNELLTRFRLPLEPWNFTWYRKFNTHGPGKRGSNILFILRNQKNILSDIRIVYSGQLILREKNSETMLTGKSLPLDRRNVSALLDNWKNYLSGLTDMGNPSSANEAGNYRQELVKAQILKFIETTIMRIS